MQCSGIVTLISDFGLEDEYVGVLKGVILSRNPQARLVDLCHAVPAGDVAAAEQLLAASWRFFPRGSVHLAVVDPAVGSSRRILAVVMSDHVFLAPDNGLLSFALEEAASSKVWQVANRQFFLPHVSATFHGRDIMAPVAAALAAATSPFQLGPELAAGECVRLVRSEIQCQEGQIVGRIVGSDHFGNLLCDIDGDALAVLAGPAHRPLLVEAGVHRRLPLLRTYSDVPPGMPLALIGSRGKLEIAVNQANAAQALGLAKGTRVAVRHMMPG